MILLLFGGCSQDKFSKDLIVSNLSLPYSANADFVFSDGESNTVGKASITKSDITTITFSEPATYSGISIKSDKTGNEDVFSFELSGIPAAVPKTIAGDLSLMFSLFSDNIPQKIDTLDKNSFRISGAVNDIGNDLIEVIFTENNMSYCVTYDSHSGVPYSVDAGNDEISVSIVLSDFKETTNDKT
ncbi:MAG: hypothetical protein IJZ20_08415 [Clostridia bacterium]|nr:hypothetical protein [Clostridia bacterium]